MGLTNSKAKAPIRMSLSRLSQIAQTHGLHVLATTDLAPLSDGVKALKHWQEQGYAGEMSYMQRAAEGLGNPAALLAEACSVICFSVAYDQRPRPAMRPGFGRVARYAWGLDYHLVFKERLSALLKALSAELGQEIAGRGMSDAIPLLERSLGLRAGLGFLGKNTMLIRPGRGSFFFLAELIVDFEIERDVNLKSSGSCGSCSRCLDNCPTKALVEPGKLDSRLCISYLSIEKRGALLPWERRALGEWLFGCDICQDVCPFNHAPLKIGARAEVSDFDFEKGQGALLNISELLKIRKQSEFKARFGKTSLSRTKRVGLLRNAACVAANTSAIECWDELVSCAREDSEAIIRQHALWALVELRAKGAQCQPGVLELILEKGLTDTELVVQNEAKALLEGSSL